MDGSLPGGVLALACGEDLAQNHFFNFAGCNACPFHRRFQRDGAKVCAGKRGQGPIETANGCAGR